MKIKPIKIIFASDSGWVSYSIRRITWSRYSHCAIVDGDYIIEAQGRSALSVILVVLGLRKNSTKLGGVVRTHIDDFKKNYSEIRYAYIDGDIDLARDMVGNTAYDSLGLIGLWINRRIDCSKCMTCSKLIWVSCPTVFRKSFANRATPQRILESSRDEL